jgi:hypothetical protein
MLARAYFSLALFAAMPAWSQTVANTSGALMLVPPPVSGQAYPTEVGSEARSNYLHAGFVINTAYNDNVLATDSTTPVADVSYSISPTIVLDQTTSRLHQTLTYSPGFTFYQQTSSRNEADQNLAFDFQYRLSPHVTATLSEAFRKSSDVFNQSGLLPSGGVISGSAQSPVLSVVAPIADQLSNAANASLTYQFSRNGMIGSSGTFTYLHYPNPNQVPGLADSNSRGGAAFYSHRLSNTQYVGATYQYSQILGSLPSIEGGIQLATDSETQTHTVLLFYTIYLKPNFSLSLSGGPQHFDISQSALAPLRSWTPAISASMGWQGSRTSFAAGYSQGVSAGGGLLGAFHTNGANASFRWQLARTWTLGWGGGYAITKNVSPSMALSNPGGHIISGSVTAQHPINERLSLEFGYTRLHQSYSSIAVVSNAPDSNREYVAISYQLTRPLGR